MDEDVRNLLIAWGLSGYVDVFSENHITMDCITLLDSMIKELIPPIGHRVNFIKNLNNWKTLMDSENDNQSNQSQKDGSISLTDYLETWKGMEDAKTLNLTKSIGVSNFNLTQMQRLWDNSKIKPAVLQIEVNPTITQNELTIWCEQHGVVVMAYSPFGGILGRKKDAPPPRSDDPGLVEIANKYKKTVPQILLRYLLDRHIVAIPRSTNKGRIKENIDIFDFKLSSEEVAKISKFNKNYRLRTPAKWYDHPYFPFEKKNLTQEEINYIVEHSKED